MAEPSASWGKAEDYNNRQFEKHMCCASLICRTYEARHTEQGGLCVCTGISGAKERSPHVFQPWSHPPPLVTPPRRAPASSVLSSGTVWSHTVFQEALVEYFLERSTYLSLRLRILGAQYRSAERSEPKNTQGNNRLSVGFSLIWPRHKVRLGDELRRKELER
ncbi:hypothetical protein CIHG_06341 [Coccidioides immitis H538.4]|uniref:Uncharacterized protein n=3 Tax=Coccidioides immitis TaxID=5501 RepID=A0A0J8TNS8_COCIT|nr:hypothetical protein CIRG_09621 [Coccidioides immitis RMSCC 2394]KMU75382.1 hypothetical protein CISG_04801 [Coccidioides immitis RMSCC 3703]KMU88541.1 hypothetical protein CIHG_06341 [Coccidioides immitis H538.4]